MIILRIMSLSFTLTAFSLAASIPATAKTTMITSNFISFVCNRNEAQQKTFLIAEARKQWKYSKRGLIAQHFRGSLETTTKSVRASLQIGILNETAQPTMGYVKQT